MMTLQTGTVILNGKYRIEAMVGKGAFAQVYRATHLELNVARAIKVLRVDAPGVGSTTFNDYRERYRQEFQIAARLDHPNVIKVYDLIEEQGALYAVLEFAPGGSVKDLLTKHGALPIDRSIQILLDCAAGLDALHEKLGVIHRDVKPANILLDAEGRAKIADLGLAQVGGGQSSMRSELGSAAGIHPGTQLYRSPEHNTWEPLAPTSDAYSLGCVAFEMLTGQIWKHVMYKTEHVREWRADVPDWLDAIIARMLCDAPGFRKSDAENPNKRYVTMGGFAVAVRDEIDRKARAKRDAEEKAKREAEDRARQKAEEDARRIAEAKAKREREERERREAEEKTKREAEQKRLAEEIARQEAEGRAREQAEREVQQKRDEQARLEHNQLMREKVAQRNKQIAGIGASISIIAGLWWMVSSGVFIPVPAPVPTAKSATQVGVATRLPERTQIVVLVTPTIEAIPTSTFIPPSNTPKPTVTPTFIPTVPPTRTPIPTLTNTPKPSATPRPTLSPTPSPYKFWVEDYPRSLKGKKNQEITFSFTVRANPQMEANDFDPQVDGAMQDPLTRILHLHSLSTRLSTPNGNQTMQMNPGEVRTFIATGHFPQAGQWAVWPSFRKISQGIINGIVTNMTFPEALLDQNGGEIRIIVDISD